MKERVNVLISKMESDFQKNMKTLDCLISHLDSQYPDYEEDQISIGILDMLKTDAMKIKDLTNITLNQLSEAKKSATLEQAEYISSVLGEVITIPDYLLAKAEMLFGKVTIN